MVNPSAVLSSTRDASWRRQAGTGRRHTVRIVDDFDDDYDEFNDDDDDFGDDDDDFNDNDDNKPRDFV